MPYRWQTNDGEAPVITGASFHDRGEPPLAVLDLWAHNALTPRGFVIFIGLTCGLFLLPLLAVLGSPVLWGLLPFILMAIAGTWWAFTRSWRDRDVQETLTLWSDRLLLEHRTGSGARKTWESNSYWVRLHLSARRGSLRNYVTLTGDKDAREVELGAFLTEQERKRLFNDLQALLTHPVLSTS